MKYVITQEAINKQLDYLSRRPYGEVALIIQELTEGLVPFLDEPTEEPKEAPKPVKTKE